jgi:hypothetical protein
VYIISVSKYVLILIIFRVLLKEYRNYIGLGGGGRRREEKKT